MPKFYVLFLFILSTLPLWTQQYLQLETINDPTTIKFQSGSVIEFKTDNAEGWQRREIDRFIIKDSLILFTDGYQHVKDIRVMRMRRDAVGAIGDKMMQFGAVWTAYMLIGEPFIRGRQITTTGLVLGGVGIGGGWLFKKLFYIRKFPMGSRYRLRLLDLSMQVEEESNP